MDGEPFVPAADVYRSADGIVVRLAIPDMIEDDIDIYVETRRIIVRGFRESPPDFRPNDSIVAEWRYGFFERCIELPVAVDAAHLCATYSGGTLIIRVRS